MKILLILGIPLIAMVVLTIILFCVPSFEERWKGEASQAPGVSKPKKKLWPIIAVILLVLLIGWGVLKRNVAPGYYPIAADAQDIWPQVGETVKVKICPACWSGWVHLPPEGQSFRVANQGELEIKYWDGKRLLITDEQPPFWDRNIPEKAVFQLRGTAGEATITIQ